MLKFKSLKLCVAAVLSLAGVLALTGCGGGGEVDTIVVARLLHPDEANESPGVPAGVRPSPRDTASDAVALDAAVEALNKAGIPFTGKKCGVHESFTLEKLYEGLQPIFLVYVEMSPVDLSQAKELGWYQVAKDQLTNGQRLFFDCGLFEQFEPFDSTLGGRPAR